MLLPTVSDQVLDRLAPPPLGHDIDYLFTVREKKRLIEEKLKEINEHYEQVETKLIERLQIEGVSKASGKKATVSLQPKVRPQVVDWDLVHDFIHRHKYYHLFERRLSAAAWNELCEKRKGKPVPGTEPFVKQSLSLRTTS